MCLPKAVLLRPGLRSQQINNKKQQQHRNPCSADSACPKKESIPLPPLSFLARSFRGTRRIVTEKEVIGRSFHNPLIPAVPPLPPNPGSLLCPVIGRLKGSLQGAGLPRKLFIAALFPIRECGCAKGANHVTPTDSPSRKRTSRVQRLRNRQPEGRHSASSLGRSISSDSVSPRPRTAKCSVLCSCSPHKSCPRSNPLPSLPSCAPMSVV